MAHDEVDLRLLGRLPTGINRDPGSNVHKWLRVFSTDEKGLDYANHLFDSLALARHLDTATGGALVRFGVPVGVAREDGESDETYRIRVKAGYKRISGKATRNEILSFIASAAHVDLADLTYTENLDRDTGLLKPRYYYVDIDLDAFPPEVVNTEGELTNLVTLIDALLTDVEAAGVKGEFFAESTFSYEGDGSATFGNTGEGDDDEGYTNTSATPALGGVNDGGTWGFFT